MAKKKNKKLKQKSLHNWIPFILVLILLVIVGYFVSKRNFSAEAETYSKTYQAGKIVEKGKVRWFVGTQDSKHVYRKDGVDGKSYTERLSSNGPLVKGWEIPTQNRIQWSYKSKPIDIPKGTSKKPISVYICWKSIVGNQAAVKMMLFNDSRPRWPLKTRRGWDRMVYFHGYTETNERSREYGCAGMNDVVIEGKKSSRKYRVFVKAPGDGVRIALIKVFKAPSLPENEIDWMLHRIDP